MCLWIGSTTNAMFNIVYRKVQLSLFSFIEMRQVSAVKEKDVSVVIEHDFSPQVKELLPKTVWAGSRVLCTHGKGNLNTRSVQPPEVVQLKHNTDLISVAVFSNRMISISKKKIKSVYTRYFSTEQQYKGLGIVSSFCESTFQKIYNSKEALSLFYCLVEKNNKSSHRIVEKVGFKAWREIKTVGFSRFFPRKDAHVYDLCTCESEETQEWLSTVYEDYSFVNFDHLFKENPYYVYRDKGEVLAGVQVFSCEWEVKKIDGFKGKLVKKLVPYIPILRNVINPHKMRFLALEGLYVKEGNEQQFQTLIESLMANFGVNAAMTFLDFESKEYKLLSNNKKNGLLNSFCKDNSARLMVKAKDFSDDELSEIMTKPAYISAYDTV